MQNQNGVAIMAFQWRRKDYHNCYGLLVLYMNFLWDQLLGIKAELIFMDIWHESAREQRFKTTVDNDLIGFFLTGRLKWMASIIYGWLN